MTQQPAPVNAADRIQHLDVLRGFAVLGVLMMNATQFAQAPIVYSNPTTSPFGLDGASAAIWWISHVFFEQKFITIFSALFGVSVYLVGGEFGDRGRGAVLRRRLFWLAVVGALHGAFVWYGDILLGYAAFGFLLLFCRSWSARRLFAVGAALFLLGALLIVGLPVALADAPPEVQLGAALTWSPAPAEVQRTIAAFGGEGLSSTRANLREWRELLPFYLFFGPRVLGVMMFGLALFKTGVLQGRRSTGFYVALVVLGAAAAAVIGSNAATLLERGFPFPEALGVRQAPNHLLGPVVSLGYVGLVALVLRRRWFAPAARVIGAVGRMAFTNYLAQSLIMTTIFFGGRGLGLFGQLDRPEYTLIVLAVWALQLAWSPLWLARFRMGPLEWAWRRLSYGGPLPLSRPLERGAVPPA